MSEQVDHPYRQKTIAEIVHDYAVVRGDLVEQYARDQLVRIIEQRLARAWDEGFDAGERDVWNHERSGWRANDPCIKNPYMKGEQ